MRNQSIIASVIGSLCFGMIGCPGLLGGGSSSDMPSGAAGGLGAGGTDAADAVAAVENAEQQRFPPAPSDMKLCMLQFGQTSFLDAKKLFGPPNDESTDKSNAALSYIYAGGVSLFLSFDYHPNGVVSIDPAGIASHTNADAGAYFNMFDGGAEGAYGAFDQGAETFFQNSYLLKDANVQGRAYPPCWPHSKP